MRHHPRSDRPCIAAALTVTGLITALAGCAAADAPRRVPDDRIGTAVYVGDELARGYRPEPALVTPSTDVRRARFPAIDVHCHWTIDRDPRELLAAMDERNVTAAVNLSGGFGDDLDAMLERFHAFAPDRLIIFCNVDFSRIDDPTFGADVTAYLERAHARGVRGLKIFKDLGLRIRDASGRLVAVDDPRLDPMWATCGRLGMPVLIHTADPVAFFEPIDERNERWMQLTRRPNWSWYGPEHPSRDEVLAQRDRMLRRHRGTTFIGAHLAGCAEDLTAARRLLEEHPNLVLDIAGRVAELGRQPYAARRFLLDAQDRVMFATDRYPGRPDQPRYRVYFRFLETADEYFDYYDHPFPPTGEWKIYGVFLPDDVLKKVYHDNAVRVLFDGRADDAGGGRR